MIEETEKTCNIKNTYTVFSIGKCFTDIKKNTEKKTSF